MIDTNSLRTSTSQSDIPIRRHSHESLTVNLNNLTRIVPSNMCDNSVQNQIRDRIILINLRKMRPSSDTKFSVDDIYQKRQDTIHETEAIWSSIMRSRQHGNESLHRFFQCPATVSVIGSMTAQEVVKACSLSFMPLSQLYLFQSIYAADDYYCNTDMTCVSNDVIGDTLQARKTLYGSDTLEQLSSLKIFIVGVGAIGSEVLKVLQQLFKGVHGSGSIIITDPDHIERSNLNRQLLFREKDVGSSKSTVAANYLRKHLGNNSINITALTFAVSPETEDFFNPTFWQNIDVVITALDNTETRHYVDRLCVRHGKWMLDAGTVGLKGSTQVVIPFVSESYSSLENIPENDVPMCTVHSFPRKVR